MHTRPTAPEQAKYKLGEIEITDELRQELDATVCDLKADEAAGINNLGPEGQVRYIVDALGAENAETVLRELTLTTKNEEESA